MSKRAKKLAKYLENVLGWTIYDETMYCPKCGATDYELDDKFCSFCGTKLKKERKKQIVEEDIEDALKECGI